MRSKKDKVNGKKEKVKGKMGDTVKVYLTSDVDEFNTGICEYLSGKIAFFVDDTPIVRLSNNDRLRYDHYLEEFEVKIDADEYEVLTCIKRRKILQSVED
jgi:hypothetical protein